MRLKPVDKCVSNYAHYHYFNVNFNPKKENYKAKKRMV